MKNFLHILNYLFVYVVLLLVLNHFLLVFLRYFLGFSFVWQNELSLFLNAVIFCVAAGYTYYYNNHVRVDVIYEKFSHKTKSLVDKIGAIIFLLPLCAGIICFSIDYIINSWKLFEKSAEPSGLPFIFLFKTLIWIFPLTLLIESKNIFCSNSKN